MFQLIGVFDLPCFDRFDPYLAEFLSAKSTAAALPFFERESLSHDYRHARSKDQSEERRSS